MSCGLPVVATPIAAEGAWLTDGLDVLLASEPQHFAAQMARLYHDPRLWQTLSVNGKNNIRKHFSPEVVIERIQTTLTRVKIISYPQGLFYSK